MFEVRLNHVASEAHLSPMARTAAIVRFFPRRRRNLAAWVLFLSFMALNETRGLYVVAQFLKAWQHG